MVTVPNLKKHYLDPLNGPYRPPIGQKMKIFNFVLESKLDLHLYVKFEGESAGDGPESQKPYLDPLNGPYWPPIGQKWKFSTLA